MNPTLLRKNHFAQASIYTVIALIVLVGNGHAVAGDPLDNWTIRSSATTRTFTGVAYGNGVFVAVASVGTIRSSEDGVTWSPQTSGVSVNLRNVAFVGDRFLAVGGNWANPSQYRNYIVSSFNGTNWTTVYAGTLQSGDGMLNLNGIAGGDGKYLIVGDSKYQAGPLAVESTNGTTWTSRFLASPPGYLYWDSLYGAAWGGGRFFSVGQYGLALYSDDGTNWIRAGGGSSVITRSSVVYGGGVFADAGRDYNGGYLGMLTTSGSSGGIGGYPESLSGVVFGNNMFVTVGGNGRVVTSDSLLSVGIVRPKVTTNALNSVAFGNNTFVAVGQGGTIIQSADVTLPWFKSITCSSETNISLTIQSPPNAELLLETSTNLTDWTFARSVTNTTGTLLIEEPILPGITETFFRLVRP